MYRFSSHKPVSGILCATYLVILCRWRRFRGKDRSLLRSRPVFLAPVVREESREAGNQTSPQATNEACMLAARTLFDERSTTERLGGWSTLVAAWSFFRLLKQKGIAVDVQFLSKGRNAGEGEKSQQGGVMRPSIPHDEKNVDTRRHIGGATPEKLPDG